MQIVIDISEHDKEWIQNGYAIPDEIHTSIVESIINGTSLPDNATNGDVMKIIFPKIGLYDEWYDEPYQKGGK